MLTFGFELETQTVPNQVDRSVSYAPVFKKVINYPGMEVDTDSSVRGVEIRTVGGHTKTAALKIIENMHRRRLLTGVTIDRRCSFHVHVSGEYKGLRLGTLGYNDLENIRRLVIMELVARASSLPNKVKARAKTANGYGSMRYLDSENLARVNQIRNVKTIEIRLFGNVKSKRDMEQCLHIADLSVKAAIRKYIKFKEAL